jgi:hypothetical protein
MCRSNSHNRSSALSWHFLHPLPLIKAMTRSDRYPFKKRLKELSLFQQMSKILPTEKNFLMSFRKDVTLTSVDFMEVRTERSPYIYTLSSILLDFNAHICGFTFSDLVPLWLGQERIFRRQWNRGMLLIKL